MASKGVANPEVRDLIRGSLIYWLAGGPTFDRRQRKYALPPPKRVTNAQAEVTATKAAETEVEMLKPEESKTASNGKSGQNGSGGDKQQGKVEFSFTAEDDTKLLEMKGNGDSWKQIAQALSKPQGIIKKRFHEIASDEQKAANSGKNHAGEKKDAQVKKDNSEKKQGSNNKGSSAKNNNSTEAKKKGGSSVHSGHPAPKTTVPRFINGLETLTLRADDTFSGDDLLWFADAFMRDNTERFLRLSSRYYDLTGRRIHPELIRKKLLESGLPV